MGVSFRVGRQRPVSSHMEALTAIKEAAQTFDEHPDPIPVFARIVELADAGLGLDDCEGVEWETVGDLTFEDRVKMPYGAFTRFREELAAGEGFDINTMQGYGGDIPWEECTSPIVDLYNHSDCDGDLSAEQCREMAEPLRELARKTWPEVPDDAFATFKRTAFRLAHMMDVAAAEDALLLFR